MATTTTTRTRRGTRRRESLTTKWPADMADRTLLREHREARGMLEYYGLWLEQLVAELKKRKLKALP